MIFDDISIAQIPDIDGIDALEEILRANIEERIGSETGRKPCRISWDIDLSKEEEAYSIELDETGVEIKAGGIRGLFYGTGKFLRKIDFSEGCFSFEKHHIESKPECSLRGIYFAVHFLNWYQMASEKELERYIGDLALWGINSIEVVYPFLHLDGWETPEAEEALSQIKRILKIANKLHMKKGLIVVANQFFRTAPEAFMAKPLPDPLKRRGNLGRNLCPSIPEAKKYMLENYETLFSRLQDPGIDLLTFWPYDEGGCSCEKCFPWGANGLLNISEAGAQIARHYFPGLKVILSTWCFDTPQEGEWTGLP